MILIGSHDWIEKKLKLIAMYLLGVLGVVSCFVVPFLFVPSRLWYAAFTSLFPKGMKVVGKKADARVCLVAVLFA